MTGTRVSFVDSTSRFSSTLSRLVCALHYA